MIDPADMDWKLRLQAALGFALLAASNIYMWILFREQPAPAHAAPPAVVAPKATAAGPAQPAKVDASDDAADDTVVAELTNRRDTSGAASAIAEIVVLISVDGLRPDVIFPHSPNVHRLALEGVHAQNARTISKSSTLPSHASMVSGVDFQRHGLEFNSYRPERGHIQYPTIFSAAQRAGLSTALFVGKRKLAHLLDPENEGHFAVGGVYCSKVVKLAEPYVRQADPGIVFVHFSEPDSAGHLHGWMSDEYTAAVRRADHCVGDILEAVKARGNLERTLVVVTSDHGGHDHNHGSGLKSDKHIPWIMWGGAAQRAVRVRRPVFNTDTAATILHALGLTPPEDIEGKPVIEGLARADARPGPG